MKVVFLLAVSCSLLFPSQARLANLKPAKVHSACIKSLRVSNRAAPTRPSHREGEDSEDDERETIERLFRKFDADGNGSISGLELKKALESVGMKISALQADEYIQQYDQNDSDSIDFDEFDELYHDLLDNK